MKRSRFIAAIAFSISLAGGAALYFHYSNPERGNKPLSADGHPGKTGLPVIKPTNFNKYASLIKKFAKAQSFDTSTFILVNMGLPSGKKRLFVYDLRKRKVKDSGLVAHGGGKFGSEQPVFSNIPESWKSSLGKYQIANKYNGRFGSSYRLIGLDSSNSNAFQRAIVLHAYQCVPDKEVFPQSICNSLGCPMVSVNFFKVLDREIKRSGKPMLLWIIE